MHGTRGDKRCAGKKRRGRGGEKHGRTSDSFLHRTGNKRWDWLKGQDAGRESEEQKEGGGGSYKNVKRALQPFSRRSAGGH